MASQENVSATPIRQVSENEIQALLRIIGLLTSVAIQIISIALIMTLVSLLELRSSLITGFMFLLVTLLFIELGRFVYVYATILKDVKDISDKL